MTETDDASIDAVLADFMRDYEHREMDQESMRELVRRALEVREAQVLRLQKFFLTLRALPGFEVHYGSSTVDAITAAVSGTLAQQQFDEAARLKEALQLALPYIEHAAFHAMPMFQSTIHADRKQIINAMHGKAGGA